MYLVNVGQNTGVVLNSGLPKNRIPRNLLVRYVSDAEVW